MRMWRLDSQNLKLLVEFIFYRPDKFRSIACTMLSIKLKLKKGLLSGANEDVYVKRVQPSPPEKK